MCYPLCYSVPHGSLIGEFGVMDMEVYGAKYIVIPAHYNYCPQGFNLYIRGSMRDDLTGFS